MNWKFFHFIKKAVLMQKFVTTRCKSMISTNYQSFICGHILDSFSRYKVHNIKTIFLLMIWSKNCMWNHSIQTWNLLIIKAFNSLEIQISIVCGAHKHNTNVQMYINEEIDRRRKNKFFVQLVEIYVLLDK